MRNEVAHVLRLGRAVVDPPPLLLDLLGEGDLLRGGQVDHPAFCHCVRSQNLRQLAVRALALCYMHHQRAILFMGWLVYVQLNPLPPL